MVDTSFAQKSMCLAKLYKKTCNTNQDQNYDFSCIPYRIMMLQMLLPSNVFSILYGSATPEDPRRNLMTARSISVHFVPATRSRNSPPKAGTTVVRTYGRHIMMMHHHDDATSWWCIIMMMHHHDDASSWWCIITMMHHHDDASSSSWCIIMMMHHHEDASSS